MSYVVGVGAANVDVSGASHAKIVYNDSNPGDMSCSVGGVTRNILENLARMGRNVSLVSAVGNDVFAEKIRRDSESAGIDVSHLITVDDMPTSTYMSVLDENGDMLVAVSDMHISARITPTRIIDERAIFEGCAAVVCDPCLPVETLDEIICGTARDKDVFLDPVSTTYAKKAALFLSKLHTVKPNLLELGILSGMPTDTDAEIRRALEKVVSLGTKRVVVTLGDKGCRYFDCDGVYIERRLRPVRHMENATGAGDAFSAGLVFGHTGGMPIEKTLDYALAAGIIAVNSKSTINPSMSEKLILETIEQFKEI